MAYRLTVRHGPRVTREKFESLDEALSALEAKAKEIRSQGRLPDRKMIREYPAERQVAGRLEISTGGLFRRGKEAGLDVMGDGRLVPYVGGVRRRELDSGEDGPFAALREALSAS